MEDNNKKTKKIMMEDVVFYVILMPLVILTAVVLIQTIIHPEKIPNLFGYKMFIVLDSEMDKSISYGDLVFTKNIETDSLKNDNLIAFRNAEDKVTLHRIIDIDEIDGKKEFIMLTATNETKDTRYVKEDAVEGIYVKKIKKIGLIIMFLQEPFVFLILVCVILIIGLVVYYFAQEDDKKCKNVQIKTN